MIKLKNVSKFYYSKGVIASGFTKVNLEFHIGEFVAITGESGSGKSTLLNVISGLDSYEEGEMYVNGEETSHYLEKDWEDYRRKNIGNIYQNFNLIHSYSVYKNVELALSLNGIGSKERKKKVLDLLKRVNMLSYKNTKVSKLSGGQKQRVAIARALAKDVPIIIADEPTGNLDKASANNVIKLLKEISQDKLVIIVTHNYDQVEEYVSRKIVMHDGKVMEDKKIIPVPKNNIMEGKEYKNMRFFDKCKLGFYNTFNVLPKFVLLFLVYSFIVVALMGEYSFFKKGEYEASKLGFNYYYMDTDDHRVIVNKKDRNAFTEEELQAIKDMENVDYVFDPDVIIDQQFSFTTDNEELWLSTRVLPYERFDGKVSFGRLPENEFEMIIEGRSDDYYLQYAKEEVLNQKVYRVNSMGEMDKREAYTIVGIVYNDESSNFMANYQMYVHPSFLDKLLFEAHEYYSTVVVDFMGTNHTSNPYNTDFRLEANEWVTPGTAIVSEDYNMYCERDNCRGKSISVSVKNIYYEDTKSFTIEKLYNKNNIIYTLNLPNYKKENFEDFYNGIIYINPLDYNPLFHKGTYQISVYVDDIQKINQTVNALEEAGFHTLMIKDTLTTLDSAEIVRIVKLLVTIFLIIVLFFVSYFIIKIILKSRNIYYSILRMLGSSKKTCRELLIIELFTVSNLSYFVFLVIAECNRHHFLHIDFIDTINTYFQYKDYILLYIIIVGMSILISLRYARKLFKTSAMNAYREEV